MSVDTGTSSAVGWINLTTLLLRRLASLESCCPSRFGDPKGGILRMWSAIGFIVAVQHSSPRPGAERKSTWNGRSVWEPTKKPLRVPGCLRLRGRGSSRPGPPTGFTRRAFRPVCRRKRVSIPVHGEARFRLCQPHESGQISKSSSAVPEPDRRPPAGSPVTPGEREAGLRARVRVGLSRKGRLSTVKG